jgi:hypothetical protein
MTQTMTSVVDSTVVDREVCDHCTVQAKILVVLSSGGELTFCGHHANRHADLISRVAAQVVTAADFVWLNGTPVPAR